MTYRGKSYQAWLLAGASALAVVAGEAAAAEDASFAIAPQPLASALNEFSVQSRQSVLFTTELAQAKVSPGVSGEVEAADALARLLEGTGLTWRRQGDTFLIVQQEGGSSPQSAGAGGDVDALIVTAQKREENIQDVPIAISAFSQEDLTRSQVAGGPDLMTQVPNMTFTKTNFTSYSIQIRGIGTQAISATTDPAVAVAFNNTPFIANHFFEQEFYDLARVEVLRGPQGTLYGRNATAGVVNVISAKPEYHFEARLSGDVSNYNSSRLEGMANIPLLEDVAALRIAGAWTKREGFVENTLAGEQTDGRNLWSTRVTLGLDPTEWLNVNLIWEHFEENDDRLRSGKQLCHADPGPATINGVPVTHEPATIGALPTTGYVSQGCQAASLYSPDSFDTPNGYALPYYGPLGIIGSPVWMLLDPYVSKRQSQDLRQIETHLEPEYEASADVVELQWTADLPWNLTLSSETGFSKDRIYSFEDYNRFNTSPGAFIPGARFGPCGIIFFKEQQCIGDRLDMVSAEGVFCDPQLGCTDRLAAGDLATATSRQFSQEFRLSSDFDGRFNFSLGANFLRYDTEIKYYVFINTLTAGAVNFVTSRAVIFNPGPPEHFESAPGPIWEPGITDGMECIAQDFYGPKISNPNAFYDVGCTYIDPNDIHHLNDQGRNYFLSRNPYHLLSYAAFGEAYFSITDNLKLTAGLRWTVDKKTAPQMPSWLMAGETYGNPVRKVIEEEWQEPTGRIAMDWKPDLSFTEDSLVYASYVRGYKAGGANPPPPIPVFANVCPPDCEGSGFDMSSRILAESLTHPETFDAEYVNAYELGTKNTLLDGRLTANFALFYYDYMGYQISQIVDRAAVNLNFDATVWGAELEVDWRPLENLRLGFKGGYENTRMADGSKAIDLMDRTAGKEGWMLWRPFPTMPSNCVVPIEIALRPYPQNVCSAYKTQLDPVTFMPYVPNPTHIYLGEGFDGPRLEPIPPEWNYHGYDPTSANHGEGFEKDLSGNELPNAPDFTATITADYTLPLASDWLMTLHTDIYYQSEAWTRVFNTEGYDKLKAYNNINLAAIFTNEDAGWYVMAYVKNVLDRDSITGAFLNSDDTGLTTNVFLTEPRLYGIRVTRDFTGGPLIGSFGRRRDGPYPFTVELGGQVQRQDTPTEAIMPFADAFSAAIDPRRAQNQDLDWTHGSELRVTYRPEGSAWKIAGGVRFGRTSNDSGQLRLQEEAGPRVCSASTEKYVLRNLSCDPDYGPVDYTFMGQTITLPSKYNEDNWVTPINRVGTRASQREEHILVDFTLGRDVGIGSLAAGLRVAEFESATWGDMRGVPDLTVPEGWGGEDSTFHHYMTTFESEREFRGAGPTLSWEASRQLWGNDEIGRLNLDWTLTGGALFGKQKTSFGGTQGSAYNVGSYRHYPDWDVMLEPVDQTPIDVPQRISSATVPVIDLSLGLSLEVPGVKFSTGYRWERYFDVLDAGFEAQGSYDRTLDGPYFKVSVGLGG